MIILTEESILSLYPFSFQGVQLSLMVVYKVGGIWTDLFCFPRKQTNKQMNETQQQQQKPCVAFRGQSMRSAIDNNKSGSR